MSVPVFSGIHTVKVWPSCTNRCRTGMMWSVMLLNPPEICHLDDCKSLALNTWQCGLKVMCPDQCIFLLLLL